MGGGETTAGSVPISSSRLMEIKKMVFLFKNNYDFSLLNVNLGKIFKLLF